MVAIQKQAAGFQTAVYLLKESRRPVAVASFVNGLKCDSRVERRKSACPIRLAEISPLKLHPARNLAQMLPRQLVHCIGEVQRYVFGNGTGFENSGGQVARPGTEFKYSRAALTVPVERRGEGGKEARPPRTYPHRIFH